MKFIQSIGNTFVLGDLSKEYIEGKKTFMRSGHSTKWTPFRIAFVALLCIVIVPLLWKIMKKLGSNNCEGYSGWVVRVNDHFLVAATSAECHQGHLSNPKRDIDARNSPFLLPSKSGDVGVKRTPKMSSDDVKTIKIGYQDPKGELKHLGKTNFKECEYNQCEMTENKGSSDVVLFLQARLTREQVPTFKRKPGQLWLFKTDEAPSRFTWFQSLNRTGLKEQFNLTLTHKLDSDIPFIYGRLIENDKTTAKDYDAIYNGKTKMAAWFVSHCLVRSRRKLFVDLMKERIDVDVFGVCGTLSCGTAEKAPGITGLRAEADKTTCLPMLSRDYMFYLAFENSLCQEYISEKFFKLFNDVDVVPVVRGGANYKSYIPSDMYVDASDFDTPTELADFLDDLANDKERYISYLKRKDRYRMVPDFPEWQCKLCEKLHTDKNPHLYEDVHQWWTKDSCHDPQDSLAFL